jgi:hypothetical protein
VILLQEILLQILPTAALPGAILPQETMLYKVLLLLSSIDPGYIV